MDLADIHGRSLALLLMGKTEEGEDDWAVLAGTANVEDGELRVLREGDEPPFTVAAEFVPRIRMTTDDQRAILLNAELVLPLTVAALPDDADPSDYVATGPRWPDDSSG